MRWEGRSSFVVAQQLFLHPLQLLAAKQLHTSAAELALGNLRTFMCTGVLLGNVGQSKPTKIIIGQQKTYNIYIHIYIYMHTYIHTYIYIGN